MCRVVNLYVVAGRVGSGWVPSERVVLGWVKESDRRSSVESSGKRAPESVQLICDVNGAKSALYGVKKTVAATRRTTPIY